MLKGKSRVREKLQAWSKKGLETAKKVYAKQKVRLQKRKWEKRKIEFKDIAENALRGGSIDTGVYWLGQAGDIVQIEKIIALFLREKKVAKLDKTVPFETLLGLERLQLKAMKGLNTHPEFRSPAEQQAFSVYRNEFGHTVRRLRKKMLEETDLQILNRKKKQFAIVIAEMGKGNPENKYFQEAAEIARELNEKHLGNNAVEIAFALGVPVGQIVRRVKQVFRAPREKTTVVPINRAKTDGRH